MVRRGPPYFDAKFWSWFFRDSFSRQITTFCIVLEERVLPVFADAEREADEVNQRESHRLGSLPGGECGPLMDMVDAAEMAQEAGLAHYETMTAARQAFLNLGAASLRHLFEQQLLVFHRRQVLSRSEEHDPQLGTRLRFLYQRLAAAGIRLERFPAWETVEELRLTANVVKHGQGESAGDLRKIRPQLFAPPSVHGTSLERVYGGVNQPLAGEDLFVTVEDIRRYGQALVEFWTQLGEAILYAQENG